jgi:hypothetical protein
MPTLSYRTTVAFKLVLVRMLPPVAYQTYLDLYAARSPHIENRKPVQCPTQHEPLACGCLGNKVCVLCSRKMLSLWAAVLTPRAHNLSLCDCLHRYVLGCLFTLIGAVLSNSACAHGTEPRTGPLSRTSQTLLSRGIAHAAFANTHGRVARCARSSLAARLCRSLTVPRRCARDRVSTDSDHHRAGREI